MRKVLPHLFVMLSMASMLHAQPTMIGISYQNQGAVAVVRRDAATGTVLDSVLTNQSASVSGSSVYDAYNGNYYFDGSQKICRVGFYPASLSELTTNGIGFNTEIDISNGGIFSVRSNYVYSPQGVFISVLTEIVRYNIADSTVTVMGTLPSIVGFFSDANCFNSNSGIYYLLGLDSLGQTILISIPTRTVGFNPTFTPLANSLGNIFTLEYDNGTDAIYALANDGTMTSDLKILQIDPATGSWTLEANLPQLLGYVTTTTSYDQASNSMVMVALNTNQQYQFYSYSTTSHSLTTKMLPSSGQYGELECDNTAFALARYGSATALSDEVSNTRISLYPIPAQDYLQLAGNEMPVALQIIDAVGRITSVTASGSSLNVSHLAPGCYFLRSSFADGQTVQSRFEKQ